MSVLLKRIEKLEAANRPPPPPEVKSIRFVRIVLEADGSPSSAIFKGGSIVRSYDESESDFRERAMKECRAHAGEPCVMVEPLDEDL